MPAFRQVLDAVTEAWRDRRDEVRRAPAQRIVEAIASRAELARRRRWTRPCSTPRPASLRPTYDAAHGGFGGAPKFPPSMVLEFLLRQHARTGDPARWTWSTAPAEAMARGGIYDQLAGGFARYSVDAGWVVPHFEKMLYDNALLLRVYPHLWRRPVAAGPPGGRRDRRVPARATCAPRGRVRLGAGRRHRRRRGPDLRLDAGAAASRCSGDEDGAWAAELFAVTAAGTFEHGRSTLQLPADPDDARPLDARAGGGCWPRGTQRPQPARDDKVVAAWNGLAIAALAEAGAGARRAGLGRRRRGRAPSCCSASTWYDGRLRRVSRDGVAGAPAGVLEDYARPGRGAARAAPGHRRAALAGWRGRAARHGARAVRRRRRRVLRHRRRRRARWSSGPSTRPTAPTPVRGVAAAGALLGYAALAGSDRAPGRRPRRRWPRSRRLVAAAPAGRRLGGRGRRGAAGRAAARWPSVPAGEPGRAGRGRRRGTCARGGRGRRVRRTRRACRCWPTGRWSAARRRRTSAAGSSATAPVTDAAALLAQLRTVPPLADTVPVPCTSQRCTCKEVHRASRRPACTRTEGLPGTGRGRGGPRGWQQADVPRPRTRRLVRRPAARRAGSPARPSVTVDRDEIRWSAPGAADADAGERPTVAVSAAEAGRISRFREDTRDAADRDRAARPSTGTAARSPGAPSLGGTRQLFTTLSRAGDDPAAAAGAAGAGHAGRRRRGPVPVGGAGLVPCGWSASTPTTG